MSEVINPFHNRHVVFIPQKLDLDKLLFDNPIEVVEHRHPDKIKNRLAFLLGQIYIRRRKLKNKCQRARNGYVRLCNQILRRYIRKYPTLIRWLISNGVVEHTANYAADTNTPTCNEYRITDKFYGVGSNGSKWKAFYIYESAFVKKIDKILSELYRPVIDGHSYLIKHFEHLDYDDDIAKGILDSYIEEDNVNRYLDVNALNRIRTNYQYQFSREKYGRFYSPFTNMNKKLRLSLRCGGEELEEIDIKTSIPYFALSLFDNHFLECNSIAKELLRHCNSGLWGSTSKKIDIKCKKDILHSSYLRYNRDICFHLMTDKKGERDLESKPYKPNLWELYEDIAEYRDIVLNDDIYQFVADLWNTELGTEYSRNDCKKLLLEVFNSPSKYVGDRRKVLRRRFPNVIKVYEYVNTGYFTTRGGKGKNEWKEGDLKCPFALYTQGLEAWFVLDVVCRELNENYPHVKYYTIHDAIYTNTEHIQLVKNKIYIKSNFFFGNKINI